MEKLNFITKHKKLIITALLLAVTAVVVLHFLDRKEPEEIYPVVTVERVKQEDVAIYGEYVGRIRAQQFVEIRARVEGYLEKMLFEEGTFINKNQLLFIISQDRYKARVDKAKAQLNKDKAQARKAERDLERIRPLYEQNAASQLDLDNAIAQRIKATLGITG